MNTPYEIRPWNPQLSLEVSPTHYNPLLTPQRTLHPFFFFLINYYWDFAPLIVPGLLPEKTHRSLPPRRFLTGIMLRILPHTYYLCYNFNVGEVT